MLPPLSPDTQSEPATQVQANDQPIQSEPAEPFKANVRISDSESFNQTQPDVQTTIPQSFITHPEVHKVVVEHIVRNEALVSPVSASFRLRQFSGKSPCPTHEVDFDTWRHSVELLLQDSDLSDLQRSRKILDSLVSPAANVVKPLGPEALPSAYLELLHSAFGTVEDGDELFAKFLNTLQDAGEKPSHYLHRLQTALSKALKRGGVASGEADRHLLRQFCRGCWDNALLADLQLERKKDEPPTFTELLLQLRVEEDKHTAKESRMKKHFAATRPKVASHSIVANADFPALTMQNDLTEMRTQITALQSQLTRLKPQKVEPPVDPQKNLVTELKAQITQLQSHLATLTSNPPKKKSNPPKANAKTHSKAPERTSLTPQAAKGRPKPGYCFQCGEDGHIASACPNDPNPSLVADKRKQLKEKQLLWDRQNNQTQPLN
nr:zinc finger CCHC domain-containing protein 18-like [Nothobranchius furzeri]